MPATRKQIPGEKIAHAKYLYEDTSVPVADIAAMVGLSPRTFRSRVSEWGWKKRTANSRFVPAPPLRAGNSSVVMPQSPPPNEAGEPPQAVESRTSLVQRIQGVVEREIDAVEQFLETIVGNDTLETEAAARTLASLARTLRELKSLDAPLMPVTADDKPVPRDLDELRRSLSQKLERIVAEQCAALAGDP
jgi:hypothetical protein